MSPETLPHPAFEEQRLSTAYKFLDFIFAPFEQGFVELRYFGAGASPKIAEESDYFPLPLDGGSSGSGGGNNLADIIKQIESKNGSRMITFGPAPRLRLPKKGKNGAAAAAADVAEIACIWANLDYDRMPGGAIETMERIGLLELRPSLVVNSGFGRHVYYCFSEPLRDGRLLNWKAMTAGLREILGDETGASSISPGDVLRLPGTLNVKHEQALRCEIVEEESSWLRYSVKEVEEHFDRISKSIREAMIEIAQAQNLYAEKRVSEKDSRRSAASQFFKAGAESIRRDELRRNSPETLRGRRDKTYKIIDVAAPSVDALRTRGVSAKMIDSVITGKYVAGAGNGAVSNTETCEARDFWIASGLLEKSFTEAEVKAVFRQYPTGCGSEYAKPKKGEQYLDEMLLKAEAHVGEKLARRGIYKILTEFGDRSMPPGYELREDGSIWLVAPPKKDGGEPICTLVSSSPIRITEIQENVDTRQISVSVSYKYFNQARKTVITRAQMCNTRSLVMALADEGAPVTANNARLVVSYLSSYEHAFAEFIPRKKVTSRLGRGATAGGGKWFYLPGASGDIEFAPQGAGDAALFRAFASRRGTLAEWLEVMNTLESRNLMIPQIAVLAAFVPPLQRILQIPNFILDVFGNTSSGKSTTLKLAASVFGRPLDPESLVLQWMNTKVAVEMVAGMCSELPIFLDDAQHCPDNLKRDVIYMIANGKGKARGAGGGGIKETASWHTVALSTSEEPLHESSPHEGARSRILPLGGINPPFPPGSGALVQDLERAAGENHGRAGETFIRHINDWNDKTWMQWQRRYIALRNELLRESSSDIVGRVSGYIASIGVAGEIAAPLLGLRFQPDVMCAWLLTHLHDQQSNQNQVLMALRALADYFISNKNQFAGTENFRASARSSVQGSAQRGEYVGFLRKTIDKVFEAKKWNSWTILNKMAEAGAFHSSDKDRHTKKVRVEGVAHRMVCVKWSALLPDD